MPRQKRKKIEPLLSVIFRLENRPHLAQVYENLADPGGRGVHMRSKRSKAFDKVLLHCEAMLASESRYQKMAFERHTSGQSKVAEFARAIGPIVRPLILGKTLKEEIVEMVHIHYKAVKEARKEIAAKKP